MDDDDALQCPSISKVNGFCDFGDLFTKNWARCDIVGFIIEDVPTSRNPAIGKQMRQKRRNRSNADTSFFSDDEEDPIVEANSGADML